MIISKKYHFYSGHRNENLNDKCKNLHGHTYYVTMDFDFTEFNQATGITMLFGDIDSVVDPIINKLDHSLLIHEKDPLLKYLLMYTKEEKESLKLSIFNNVTSAENLAQYIFHLVAEILPIVKISLQETTSSTVIYETSN
tara:strand:+ start:15033 stop:15452 length:420 start_codon:yes stop_codon:yes gene_type:complete